MFLAKVIGKFVCRFKLFCFYIVFEVSLIFFSEEIKAQSYANIYQYFWKKYKIEVYSTVHLFNREYKVADLAKMADTRGVNMKNSLFKKINEKGVWETCNPKKIDEVNRKSRLCTSKVEGLSVYVSSLLIPSFTSSNFPEPSQASISWIT
jgi:hypothetical protein